VSLSVAGSRERGPTDLSCVVRFVPPNTDGDEECVEYEPEPESASSLLDPALERRVGEDIVSGNSPDDNLLSYRSPSQALHRTDSHTSHDIDSIIEYPVNIPFLPPIQDALSSNTPPIGDATIEAPSQAFEAAHHTRTNSSGLLVGSTAWSRGPPSNKHSSPSVPKRSPNDTTHISPFSNSAFSPNSSLTLRWPVKNIYEARLFHHFIVHCTPWIDVCDPRRHFEKEVPKRAAHFPVILNGILGLAARHLWLMSKVVEDYSQPYVDQCLQVLIVALEDPLAHWDENFLVAVILLRLHEEMGDADEQCHHFGTARILNSISSFAADGGLRESASWVSLRQHIYVSLTTQQTINLSLDNYRHSSVFNEYDDESWANRIIFQFANILQHVFEDASFSNSLTREKWSELDADVEEWQRTKPWTFAPLHADADVGTTFSGSWPDLFTAQGVVAVGLQYYHLCKILLTIYSPNASLVGLAGVRARKTTDASIRKHIRIAIGYGISNVHCGNAMFQGSHILSACGAYIVDRSEQAACVEYLKSLQRLIGWRTDKVLADLREQWEN